MKKQIFALMLLLASNLSYAKVQTYTILYGGGVDDTSLGLKNIKGKEISAYCLNKCGDWFEPSDEHDGNQLQKRYIGKKVKAELSYELNGDRIIGPGEDEKFFFIKSIKMLNNSAK